jgi:hypothetical protein
MQKEVNNKEPTSHGRLIEVESHVAGDVQTNQSAI